MLNFYKRQMSENGIPLNQLSETEWMSIFERIDTNRDGKISMNELRNAIDTEQFKDNIPECEVRKIMEKCDTDQSGFLEFNEFLAMMQRKDLQKLFAHIINKYVNSIVPLRQKSFMGSRILIKYSCFPPPICLLVISIIEIILFAVDASQHHVDATGPKAAILMYDPKKRDEFWRFFTYMMVHVGVSHLVLNVLVQIFLGIPLEMVHKWWRVAIVYFAGVVAGSLSTSIFVPTVKLAGASGGVYALATAHVSTLILNWSEMPYACLQMLLFSVLLGGNTGAAIYNRSDQNTAYVAHLGGAVAGLLVGIGVLRNIKVKSWEKKLWWIAVSVFFVLIMMAVFTHIFYTANFPSPK